MKFRKKTCRACTGAARGSVHCSARLGWYLHSGDKEEAMKFFPAPGEELPEKPVQEIIAMHKAAIFPRSFAKVQRMARVFIEEQFESFIC